MKKILEFFSSGSGSGSGHGYGSGYGSGYGHGHGDGSGSGYGSGHGFGHGFGHGIKTFNGDFVFNVDGVQTLIDHLHGNIAKGRVLKADLTTEPCYIVKQDGLFAHGKTLRDARNAIVEKMFDGMSAEQCIEAFMAEHRLGVEYPNLDLYNWHHRLTGSCELGRRTFADDHGIDVEHGSMTVEAFIALTRNDYGADTIRELENRYNLSPEK